MGMCAHIRDLLDYIEYGQTPEVIDDDGQDQDE